MANPIEHYLTEFHLDPARDIAPLSRLQPAPREEEPEVVDMTAMIRAAEERGREEGRARAKRDFEAALAAETSRLDERIVHERAKWVDEEATRLTGRIDEALSDMRHEADRRCCTHPRAFFERCIASAGTERTDDNPCIGSG